MSTAVGPGDYAFEVESAVYYPSEKPLCELMLRLEKYPTIVSRFRLWVPCEEVSFRTQQFKLMNWKNFITKIGLDESELNKDVWEADGNINDFVGKRGRSFFKLVENDYAWVNEPVW